MNATSPHLVLLGPTASGKTSCALRFAQEHHLEIVNCDSMQVYRGLEIGTAQPTPQEQTSVPHHLIAFLDIHQPYDVNLFLEAIRPVLADIEHRRGRALIVGGTGLYARALVYGHTLLPANPEIAQRLQREFQQPGGQQVLAQRLLTFTRDPDSIPPDTLVNPRRLLRACEILELTGKPPWELHPKQTTPDSRFRQICLLPEFDSLKERIRFRTMQMLHNGWITEAERVIQEGLLETPTARQALGYRDIADFLQGHSRAHNQDELAELLSNRTIQYARRQYTWFRHQHPGAIAVSTASEAASVMEQI
ncbi:MAG: tRNA (adenosine(37)-N6)-dimethylallyltransferase MiaA [Victivallales bacterium]|nr:tRNA (adenosine(37)-N6)-dimethylallyltransferase MiaA [Victivallales bacterium]